MGSPIKRFSLESSFTIRADTSSVGGRIGGLMSVAYVDHRRCMERSRCRRVAARNGSECCSFYRVALACSFGHTRSGEGSARVTDTLALRPPKHAIIGIPRLGMVWPGPQSQRSASSACPWSLEGCRMVAVGVGGPATCGRGVR